MPRPSEVPATADLADSLLRTQSPKLTPNTWIAIIVVALALSVFAATGASGLLVFVGLTCLAAAIYALLAGRRSGAGAWRRKRVWVTLLVAILIFTTVGIAVGATPASADTGVVHRVIDGDTVDVEIRGEVTRVRLLNVNTPETKDPDKDVECLGPEAFIYLKQLLSEGDEVKLAYDRTRQDRFDRTLAAVFAADGTLVNSAIARAGYGEAVIVGNNDKYFEDVRVAQDEARVAGRGLFSPEVTCTAPAQVATVVAQLETLVAPPVDGASAVTLTITLTSVVAVTSAIGAVKTAASTSKGMVWSVLGTTAKAALVAELVGTQGRARSMQSALRDQVTVAEKREEAARVAAEKAEAARVAAEAERAAAEAEAKRAAAEAAEVRRVEAVEEARRAAEAAPQAPTQPALARPVSPAPAPAPAPPPAPAPGGYDGYTGCRAYGGGGASIDEKGRPYNKIPCP